MTAPAHTTPEAFAEVYGWSPRRVRKLARELGACRVIGNRMILTREDVIAILASQGAEASLLTSNLFPPQPPDEAPPVPSIHGPKQGYIYVIDCAGHIKIGYSTTPQMRLNNLRSSSPFEITVLRIFEGTLEEEQALLGKFAAHRLRGEWFKQEGALAEWIAAGCPT